jgi:hypothetical protein
MGSSVHSMPVVRLHNDPSRPLFTSITTALESTPAPLLALRAGVAGIRRSIRLSIRRCCQAGASGNADSGVFAILHVADNLSA